MKAISVGSISIGSTGIAGGAVILILLLGAIIGLTFLKNSRGSKTLTEPFSEPLEGATMAKVDISTGSGSLTIDRFIDSHEALASGTLQYLENQGVPTRSMNRSNGQAFFSLEWSRKGQVGFHLPWQTCNGAVEWQIHLNPDVPTDIRVYSGGGNVKLNLAGMAVTHLTADTGGGNMDVSLPDNAVNLIVTAKTGGGNVTVDIGDNITGKSIVDAQTGGGSVVIRLPRGIAARILATSGWGKVKVDPQFIKFDDKTYQSPDYEQAANKIEITAQSGAGNVTIAPQ